MAIEHENIIWIQTTPFGKVCGAWDYEPNNQERVAGYKKVDLNSYTIDQIINYTKITKTVLEQKG